uniref:Uncharacterized protein n=1 Tax=Anguilla anguilla TaxID=7936 RepID=A0A0E9R098_ANGAN
MVLTVHTVTTERLSHFMLNVVRIINKNNHEMTLLNLDLNSVRGGKLFNLLRHGD